MEGREYHAQQVLGIAPEGMEEEEREDGGSFRHTNNIHIFTARL